MELRWILITTAGLINYSPPNTNIVIFGEICDLFYLVARWMEMNGFPSPTSRGHKGRACGIKRRICHGAAALLFKTQSGVTMQQQQSEVVAVKL